jgi:hypothetical protein
VSYSATRLLRRILSAGRVVGRILGVGAPLGPKLRGVESNRPVIGGGKAGSRSPGEPPSPRLRTCYLRPAGFGSPPSAGTSVDGRDAAGA